MRTLALVTALILHLTGLWPHIGQSFRQSITNLATQQTAISAPATYPTLPAALPVPLPSQEPLSLPGSVYALDTATSIPLYESQATQGRPVASITKLVTALVILSRHQPDESITIPTLPAYSPDDAIIHLNPGETYHVQDLIQALLLPSADDAADALAIWDAGSAPAFARRMNAKIQDWGITGAHFSSPSGLQDQNNYATAQAVALIAQLALKNNLIRATATQPAVTITSAQGHAIQLQTTDELLANDGFYGIKTGYTQAAGQCFVGVTKINGHEVITVVLGQTDRFGSTKALASWIRQNWQWLLM